MFYHVLAQFSILAFYFQNDPRCLAVLVIRVGTCDEITRFTPHVAIIERPEKLDINMSVHGNFFHTSHRLLTYTESVYTSLVLFLFPAVQAWF
jgi:hypothetical protein